MFNLVDADSHQHSPAGVCGMRKTVEAVILKRLAEAEEGMKYLI